MTLTVKGTPLSAASTSVTIPTHAVGDIIVLFAYRDGNATAPTKPAAAGTVPAWSDIDNNAGANTNSSRTAYFVATATNHTSGAWANATGMVAAVLSGQALSPIGGHSESGSTGTNTATAPAVTLTDATGTSVLLHFYGHRTVTAWSAAPAGYTRQTSVATEVALNTKDSTTSDGAIAQPATTTNSGYRGATVEILAAPKVATLVDAFDTKDLTKWSWDASADTVGGQVNIVPPSGGATDRWVSSNAYYDLIGSAVTVQLVQSQPASTSTSNECGLRINTVADITKYEAIVVNRDTGIHFRENAGSNDDADITFDVSINALRIRESGGTVFWDTSSDGGVNWTNRRSKTPAAGVPSLARVQVVLFGSHWNTETTPGTAIFDNVNITIRPSANINRAPMIRSSLY